MMHSINFSSGKTLVYHILTLIDIESRTMRELIKRLLWNLCRFW